MLLDVVEQEASCVKLHGLLNSLEVIEMKIHLLNSSFISDLFACYVTSASLLNNVNNAQLASPLPSRQLKLFRILPTTALNYSRCSPNSGSHLFVPFTTQPASENFLNSLSRQELTLVGYLAFKHYFKTDIIQLLEQLRLLIRCKVYSKVLFIALDEELLLQILLAVLLHLLGLVLLFQ